MEIKTELSFTELAKIGDNGWNSEVFLGNDPQLGTNFAYKKIKKDSFRDACEFFGEAQKIQKARHPHVVEIKYACQTSDAVWLAMPYYDRGSLQGVLNQRFLTVRESIHYAVHFLTGLQHIHAQKLLHLDIKPANILIDEGGNALLADFGCARDLDENFLATPGAIYPLHQVPERFTVAKVSIASDIYLSGLTLYRLCNGDALFFQPISGRKSKAETEDQKVRNKLNDKIKKGKYPDRSAFLPHIPQQLRRAIRKALMVDPDERFQSASDFINALSGIETNLDWQFTEEPQEKCWTLESPASITRIRLVGSEEKKDVSITTTKTNLLSGNTQRSVKHCGTRACLADGLKWVADIAEELGSC